MSINTNRCFDCGDSRLSNEGYCLNGCLFPTFTEDRVLQAQINAARQHIMETKGDFTLMVFDGLMRQADDNTRRHHIRPHLPVKATR